eukprot:3783455-Pyramimonas_sp.AAC.1
MTRTLAARRGNAVSPLRPACGVEDTPLHRVMDCGALGSGRSEQGDAWPEAVAALRSCADCTFECHLLPQGPSLHLAPPSSVTRAFVGDEEVSLSQFRFVSGEPVAGDGSASTSLLESLRRGGFGVVQWNPATGKLHRLLGTLPPTSAQTAVEAEHQAFAGGARFSDGSCDYVGDCSAVLSIARAGVVA